MTPETNWSRSDIIPAQTTVHLNLRWTMADMDRLSEMLRKRHPVSDIAFMFGVHPQEVRDVVARNPHLPRAAG
ncbi:hypothetical protein GCM10007989_07590 [Devosia pacifica]|uniref:Uncharacterized protein n=1 Tax=Devosia pacifica TaxID=1335967 RepID=A0A918RY47_9HYPH|nr:hypothetical protein [Devosia pacifica]GHA15306.1 hypothetical protein GCM10007989_07590 [Devosia pacifica]